MSTGCAHHSCVWIAGIICFLAAGRSSAQTPRPEPFPVEFSGASAEVRRELVNRERWHLADRFHECVLDAEAARVARSPDARESPLESVPGALAAMAESEFQIDCFAADWALIQTLSDEDRRIRQRLFEASRAILVELNRRPADELVASAERALSNLSAFAEAKRDREAGRGHALYLLSLRRWQKNRAAVIALLPPLMARLSSEGLNLDSRALLAAADWFGHQLNETKDGESAARYLRSVRHELGELIPPLDIQARLLSLEAEVAAREFQFGAAAVHIAGLETALGELEPIMIARRSPIQSGLLSEWWRQIALTKAQAGDHTSACQHLQHALHLSDVPAAQRFRASVALARETLARGDLLATLSAAEHALDEAPGSGDRDLPPTHPMHRDLRQQLALVSAEALTRLGRADVARRSLERAEKLKEEGADTPELLAALELSRGLLASAEGDLESSEAAYHRAIEVLPEESRASERALALTALSRLYLAMGSASESETYARRALAAADAADRDRVLLVTLSRLGLAHVALTKAKPAQAVEHLIEVKSAGARILEVRTDLELEWNRLDLEAQVQLEGLGKPSEAHLLSLASSARSIAEAALKDQDLHNPREVAEIFRLLELQQTIEHRAGLVESSAAEVAFGFWKELAEVRDLTASSFEWNEPRALLHSLRGRHEERAGRLVAASQHFKEAVRLEDALRRSLRQRVPDELSGRFAGWHDHLCGLLFAIAAERRDQASSFEALQIQESLRNQSLRALLRAKLAKGEEFRARGVPGSTTLTSLSLQDLRGTMRDGRVVLVFSLTERGCYVVLAEKNRLATIPLETTRLEVERRVHSLLDNLRPIEDEYARRAVREESEALYRLLIKPVEFAVGAARELIFVPDGSLHLLPFEALIGSPLGKSGESRAPYLIETPTLDSTSTVPSLSMLIALEGRAPPRAPNELLVVGPPHLPLPGFPVLEKGEDESDVWTPHFDASKTRRLRGKEATLSALLAERPGEFRRLHFVTHARHFRGSSLAGGLYLSPESEGPHLPLSPREIASWGLDQVELVILSACGSSRGPDAGLEGPLGLPRAFLVAGARSVIATSHDVLDRAPRALLDRLAIRLSENPGRSPARSLLLAKRDLLRSGATAWPGNWAPFLFLGAP